MTRSIPSQANSIISNSYGLMRWGGRKKGAYRIQQVNPEVSIDDETIKTIIRRSKNRVEKIVKPGFPGALSGRYDTWFLRTANKSSRPFSVVFGLGRNRGQRFEDQVLNDLVSSHAENKSSALYDLILDKIKLDRGKIDSFSKASSRAVKRTITTKTINVGDIISDININLKDKKVIHLSLKNEDGDTFANAGYHGGFKIVENNRAGPSLASGQHELDDFVVNGLGIDKTKAARRIGLVNKGKVATQSKVRPKYDEKKIKQYLCSAYGFGYWYVRGQSNGGWSIIDLTNSRAVSDKIGKIRSVIVSYPYWEKKIKRIRKRGAEIESTIIKSSKQITAWVLTTKATYVIEIRNSHRGLNPNEIKIKVTQPRQRE